MVNLSSIMEAGGDMGTIWRWLTAILTWLSADPVAIDREAPKAAAAVAVAYAAVGDDEPAPAPPGPAPVACDCGQTCRGGVWKPDGRIEQRCECQCQRCKAERAKSPAPCPDGKCPTVRR